MAEVEREVEREVTDGIGGEREVTDGGGGEGGD